MMFFLYDFTGMIWWLLQLWVIFAVDITEKRRMYNKTQKLGFGEIRRAIAASGAEKAFRPFVADGFVMLRGNPFLRGIVNANTPYIIEDVRVVLVERGTATITVNLMDYEIKAGDIMIANYGAVFQPKRLSADLQLLGMMLSPELVSTVLDDRPLQELNSPKGVTFVQHSELETQMARQMLDTLWELLQAYGFQHTVVHPALRMYLEYLYLLHQRGQQDTSNANRHGYNVFLRFLALVNKHCQHEHNIDFYAAELFITPRYLGSLVKQQSGLTAKEWIDKAIVTQAKMLLKSTDLQAAQIAARLNFTNASFFSKFFKRLTGMTPQEYRES